MATSNLTTLAALIKKMYSGDAPKNVAQRSHPFLSMVKKQNNFVGSDLNIPVVHGLPASLSRSVSTSITNASSSSSVSWTLTRAKLYNTVVIDSETLMAMRNDAGSFVRARKAEVDSMLMHMGQGISAGLFQNSGGSIGVISSISTDTITLTDADDAIYFYPGMEIAVSADDGSDSGDALRTGTTTVQSVDLDAGTVTADENITAGISAAAANDFIFPACVSADLAQGAISGLAGWLPLTAESSGTFFGVDRTTDVVRLQGHRLNDTASSIEENIQTLAAKMARTGTSGNMLCLLGHTSFANLVKSLGSKREYMGNDASIGFSNVVVHSAVGDIKIVPDSDCPSNRGYILDLDTWALHTLGEAPHLVDDDGNVALRQSSADGIEIRGRFFGNLACNAPARNGVFAI